MNPSRTAGFTAALDAMVNEGPVGVLDDERNVGKLEPTTRVEACTATRDRHATWIVEFFICMLLMLLPKLHYGLLPAHILEIPSA